MPPQADKGGSILVLDVGRLLDESEAGQGAARALEARFQSARAEHDRRVEAARKKAGKQREDAERDVAASSEKARAELEKERAALREKLLDRARKTLTNLMAERGASLVLPASAVIAWGKGVDVTDEVMKAVDEQGPL